MRRLAIVAVLAAGCSSGSSNGMLIDPGPAPMNGMQLVLDPVSGIMPGQSLEYCTWTNVTLTNDINVKQLQTYQSEGGHHIVLFYTMVYQPPGTQRLCTDADMATFRFAVAAAAPPGQAGVVLAPGDLAFPIPAGAQLVVNQHFLNATKNVLTAQSAMNLTYVDPGAHFTPAGSLAFLDDTMSIPPGDQSLDVKCTTTRDFQIWSFFPHMHQWGKHMTVTAVLGGTPKTLWDNDWEPDWQFSIPDGSLMLDPSAPMMLKKGDQLNLHCEWNNTTNGALTFGMEMCVGFGETINADNQPNLACDKGNWTNF